MYCVIYDGNCNLCVNLVRTLESIDQGQRFQYLPMQNQPGLAQYGITPTDCEAGMILLDQDDPTRRWQGSNAAEEIGRLLPVVQGLVEAYRALPGTKATGDLVYTYIRDNRYSLFGQRQEPYQSVYPLCQDQACREW
jgi:predicted DCC family thiol-disulfide oxidoreductase YuxK